MPSWERLSAGQRLIYERFKAGSPSAKKSCGSARQQYYSSQREADDLTRKIDLLRAVKESQDKEIAELKH